jgi:hypothetical protein
MASTSRGGVDPNVRLAVFALASGLPLACYIATASAHGYWLDAGEFVAQGTDLDLSHPPGHPLAGVVFHAATLFPLGPLPFRVAIASALLTAVAAAFLFRAIETTILCVGPRSRWIATPIAIGATWLVAGSLGWWLQAVRPEVYALSAALACIALERVIALEAAWPTRDLRPLYVACLCIGLALANHHFLAFLMLPAVAPTLARARRACGNRALAASAGFVAAGLSTYAYLPARTAAGAPLSLGHPDSLERLYWVVSAEAFQKNTAQDFVPQPVGERVMDVAVQLVDSLHWAPVLAAIGGLWILIRIPGARRIGWVWGAVAVVFLAARAWLGFVRDNPDALGYLMPAFGAVGALAAAFVGKAIALGGAATNRPPKIGIAFAIVVGGLGIAQLHHTVGHVTFTSFFATDAFDDPGRRDLPPHAIVLAHQPQTIFRYWGGEAAERVRPDVTLVPMPLLTYPAMVDGIVERDPDVAEVLRGYLLDGELREGDLQSLAARRPLLVELDPRVGPDLYDTLVARGLYHEVLPDRAYADDQRAGALIHDRTVQWLYKMLGPERTERETANQLLWHHYMSALFYAQVGDREAARLAVRRGRGINPHAAELAALDRALASGGEGPLDVAPFFPNAP